MTTIFPPSDELEAGPVLPQRGDLHIDEAEGQEEITESVLGEVADMAGGLAGPGDPEHGVVGEVTGDRGVKAFLRLLRTDDLGSGTPPASG
ncbi:hypothetical protein U5640_19645 [Streptomyces sp. SS7]|uniref:hypothetical protein n=1 Tax=Streptomyces sp. SS7 TaxID=3108485 RepID=UPI0030EF23BE